MIWRCGARAFDLSQRALAMGILNATPDSFSDGGRWLDPERAADRALEMEAEGAAVIDLGGESTRPGAEPVPADEEWRRVCPILERLAGRLRSAISIDTRKAAVARRALELGAEIVNDVSALRDPEMAEVVASASGGLALMHMQGEPRTMQADPRYEDPVREISDFLAQRMEFAVRAGIAREAIALDPGFGFGKAYEHNFEIAERFAEFARRGRPMIVGISRKRFIRRWLEPKLGREPAPDSPEVRAAALEWTSQLLRRGARVIRTHDVAGTVKVIEEEGLGGE